MKTKQQLLLHDSRRIIIAVIDRALFSDDDHRYKCKSLCLPCLELYAIFAKIERVEIYR
jgi:hypothetical protein